MSTPVTPKTKNPMLGIKEQLWLMIKRQGISFIIILAVAYFFYKENEKMRLEIKAANEEVKNYYKTDNADMRRIIQRSNEVIERNNQIIEKYLNSEK